MTRLKNAAVVAVVVMHTKNKNTIKSFGYSFRSFFVFDGYNIKYISAAVSAQPVSRSDNSKVPLFVCARFFMPRTLPY